MEVQINLEIYCEETALADFENEVKLFSGPNWDTNNTH